MDAVGTNWPLPQCSAAHPVEPIDAVHEVLDRLHHERIGRRHREGRARLGQFDRLAGWANQAVMANALEARNALQRITGFMQSFVLCGVCCPMTAGIV